MEKMDPNVRKNMKSLWNDKKYCDFSIMVEDKVFPVHKLIMASYSDYFKCMFDHNSLESKENVVKLTDVSSSAMESILQFCYTSELDLNDDNVQDILVAAHRMQVCDVEDLCVDYIKRRIEVSNCLGILTTSDICQVKDLYEASLHFCLDKFSQVTEEREFLELDDYRLALLLSHDELNVSNEGEVLDAIMKWISADYPERSTKFEQLLHHLRIALLDPVEIINLARNKLVHESHKCRDLIDDAKDFLLLEKRPEDRSHLVGPRFEPRIPLHQQQRVYAVGGWTNQFKPIASVEKYNPYTGEWVEVNPMSRPRCGVGVAILKDSLYAVGGHDGQNYLKSVERFDLNTETWHSDVADMRREKTSVGVVTLDGFIYSIGGQFGTTITDRVEKFDPETNTWEESSPLLERRLGAGVIALNGLIYVLGGADANTTNTVEYYDPKSNFWNYVAPMKIERKHLGCAALNGKIYAVGGRDKTSELITAECYDPVTDQWEPIASMSEKRSGIGLVELDGTLLAVGGHNGDVKLNLVESYDPRENKWTIREPMNYERLGGGLVVYSKVKYYCEKLN